MGEDFRGAYTYLLSVRKPVIAALNGAAAGMAVPIACACDLRFASERAVFTVAFSKRGLIAEWGSVLAAAAPDRPVAARSTCCGRRARWRPTEAAAASGS